MKPCANESTCIDFDRAAPGWTRGDGYPLCDACLVAGARDIAALTLDYRDLAQMLAPGRGAPIERASSDDPIPLDLGVDALMRDIAWTLAVWEPPVREAARLSPETTVGVRPGWAVAAAVDVLAPRVQVLAALPLTCGYADGLDAGPVERDGVYALASLRALHRRARSMLGLTRLVVRLPGACSGCGATALERENGSEDVACSHCRRRWTGDDYRRYVGMELAAMGRPAP